MSSTHSGHIHGLKQFKWGDTILGDIADEGVDWGGDEPSTVKIYSAQKHSGSPVVELIDNPGTDELSFKLIQCDPTHLAMLCGGSVQTNKWLASKAKGPVVNKFEIITDDGTVIAGGKASLIATIRGKITGKELLTIQCKMTILDDGTENPYTIKQGGD